MTIPSPVCLGVCCPRHAQCARYKAVDFAPMHVIRIYFCVDYKAQFIPLQPELSS